MAGMADGAGSDLVEVIVPLQGDCPYRQAAWEWVRGRYAVQHPEWRLCLAGGVRSHAGGQDRASNALPDGRFCKAALVNPKIEASDAEIVVVADADCFTDGLAAAVAAVKDGAPWAIPHNEVRRLSEQGTAAVLAGAESQKQALAQKPYPGLQGGGFVAARRETLLEIPMDPRFAGWGQEDHSWGMALLFLAGPAWRGKARLYHLWHPEPKRLSRKWGSIEGRALLHRYLQARSDPRQMKALIEEAKNFSHRPVEQASHDHLSV